ncbi:MAG TPA: zf-HC2 domain-containing protein [Planctomycetota bacterium]|nr:zf-HC2 domain-containing protein [Planctomycetota bacterium]
MSEPLECRSFRDSICEYLNEDVPESRREEMTRHVESCSDCRAELEEQRAVSTLLSATIANAIPAGFNDRLKARSAQKFQAEGALLDGMENESNHGWRETVGAAPWWAVSVVLHGLVIALAGLISMAIELPQGEASAIMVTELSPRPPIELEANKPKMQENSALHSKQETPPTDPTSKEMMDVIVPPELLKNAQLGDHFETINPDRPDTASAFGNPDAHIFHSAKGSEEPEGGGGTNGNTLDDVIGVGGSGSPGSGGGWGGGHGTGIGTGNGRGSGTFGNRSGGGRKLMVMKHGGNKATEDAVQKALEWLARHQEADGSWIAAKTEAGGICIGSDPGLTGLALLAFLGAGHSEKAGHYKDNVTRAVNFLIQQQGKNGAIAGDPKWRGHHTFFAYNHSICGMALAEAAAMGNIPATREAAQKAVDYTIFHQFGEGSDRLGWRYAPKEAVADMSVAGWFIMQLKSAKVAGLKVDAMALEGAKEFMKTREADAAGIKREDSAYDNGRHRYGYTEKGTLPNTTAIGVLCQLYCGTPREEVTGAAMYLLRTNPPKWDKNLGMGITGSFPFYYTYYTSLAMFQVGGDHWKKWNEGLKKMLLENQRKDGDFAGSWDPMGLEACAGRVYSTALACLSFEVYYRYAKLHE